MNAIEQEFYELALDEVVKRTVIKGLFAKAYSDCNGDEQKSIARYITLRVEQLKKEHQRSVREFGKDLKARICANCIFFVNAQSMAPYLGNCKHHQRETHGNSSCEDFSGRKN
jgi:hypothetical protein